MVESLIGAFYAHGGLSAGISIIHRMGLVPSNSMVTPEEEGDHWLASLMTEDDPGMPQGFSSFIARESEYPYNSKLDVSGS